MIKSCKFKRGSLLFYCFLFLFVSCKKDKDTLLAENLNSVSTKIHQMILLDQNVRKSIEYLRFFFGKKTLIREDYLSEWGMSKKTDSLYFLNYHNPDNIKYPRIQRLDYKEAIKEYDKAMFIIDSLNTVELINLTKKYGFPGYDRMKKLAELKNIQLTSKIKSPVLIFVHSPNRFFNQLAKLIEKEFLKGNIDCRQCSYIFWHLNGRMSTVDWKYCKGFLKE